MCCAAFSPGLQSFASSNPTRRETFQDQDDRWQFPASLPLCALNKSRRIHIHHLESSSLYNDPHSVLASHFTWAAVEPVLCATCCVPLDCRLFIGNRARQRNATKSHLLDHSLCESPGCWVAFTWLTPHGSVPGPCQSKQTLTQSSLLTGRRSRARTASLLETSPTRWCLRTWVHVKPSQLM